MDISSIKSIFVNDLLSVRLPAIVWFLMGMLGSSLLGRMPAIKRLMHTLGFSFKSDSPDLRIKEYYDTKSQLWKLKITNASSYAAKAVKVYLYELFHCAEPSYASVRIVDDYEAFSDVLIREDPAEYEGRSLIFDGCSLTCTQEMWIEYSDMKGCDYRIRILPSSPRGGRQKMLAPKRIKSRLPGEKGWSMTFEPGDERIMEGKLLP